MIKTKQPSNKSLKSGNTSASRNMVRSHNDYVFPKNVNANDIPYAKAVPNPLLNQFINDQNNSSLGSNIYGLPVVRTPQKYTSKMNNYQEAYEHCGKARDLIQTRLNKLMYEKSLLNQMKSNYNQYNPDIESLYKLRTLGNAKGKLGNPHLYSNHYMDPIYYPLEMPICAEPVTLPKIEIGHPMARHKHCGLGIEDLIGLLGVLKRNPPKPVPVQILQAPAPQIVIPPIPDDRGRHKERKETRIPIIPETKKKPPIKDKLNSKRDWWRLCRDFVNCYLFFSTAKKYSSFSKVRNNLISEKTRAIVQDIQVLKEWIISITEPFWEEFKVFTDLNVSFSNIDSKLKITKENQKIIAMIRKFLEALIANSSKLVDIPERVQEIIYNYIKERAYYPKKYMSTFQVNRIDFNFYGGIKNIQDDQLGMLVALLLISGITVQQILLHMKDNFIEFRNYPNIEISAKYIGSIMHYLTRDTFRDNPTMLKEILALMNYYRNYHTYNETIEKQDDIFNNNAQFLDVDEYADYLVDEKTITEFWNLNADFVTTFKNYLFQWACRLGKLIRLKFQKSDVNLLPKRGKERPPDKTASYKVIEEEWEVDD